MSSFKFTLYSVSIGFLNGLFGSGGGIISVVFLEKLGITGKKAHATSLLIILPLTIFSSVLYLIKGNLPVLSALPYLPLGMVGCIIGGKILKKIDDFYLKKIFAIFIIYSAVRMFLKW